MYELLLPVLAAIDLGHPQIERYGRLSSPAHVCLGALEADPVRDVAGRSRVERLESILTAAGEQGTRPVHIAPKLRAFR
jgi:hypothetical protein